MRTTVQRVALIFGVVFILVALLGFFTDGGMRMDTEDPGLVLGLFPVNLLHNLVHLAFGVWGIAASRTWSAAVTYCRVGGVIYLVLALLGFVAPDGFGLVPLGGNDIWLHVLLGVALAAVGFTARDGRPTTS
jgi:Domain of unknown function (DUF4383)